MTLHPAGPPDVESLVALFEARRVRWVLVGSVAAMTYGADVDPGDPSTMDALFRTRWGNFDVVPEIAGTHKRLMERATRSPAFGHELFVAHVDDLLAHLTVHRRTKDVDRVRALRAFQRARAIKEG